MARPTAYTKTILAQAKNYLDDCIDETKDVVSGQSEKFTAYKEKVTVKLPSIEGLARVLGIHKDTIYEWEKIHPEFSDVINALRNEQAARLINMGLSGDYNPVVSKLLLMKHGYADKSEFSGPNGGDIPLPVTMTDVQFNQLISKINEASNAG